MKIFRTIVSFFQALLPFLLFCFLALVIYSEFKSPFNLIAAFIPIIVGLFISRKLFNMMMRRGIIATMSGDNASYELDELEPIPGDGVIKLNPQELTRVFLDNQLRFDNGTTVSIWGDWEGRKLDVKHKLKLIDYNTEDKILTIEFKDKCLLKIKSPSLILYSSSYLKIVKAKEILWQIPLDPTSNNQFNYLNTGKEIKTKSNNDWKPHVYDIGIGMNAIYLQG